MTPNAWFAIGALGFTILLQMIGLVMWLTRLDMRLRSTERTCEELRSVGERLVRIETEMHGLRDDVRGIGAGLDWLRSVPGYTPPVMPRTPK